MAYKALYRTYRPANFNEIAGQEHITKTFMNALRNNKIAHAYLFSGPRGTGKTSIAKIIAKAVNCEKAPVENPCNECEVCKGIDNNTISDVIEIDAASNNGVDEIREIRDKVKYLPGVGTYKVYIIDEVHMLSTGAFNALLKTLEEPPKHVIFILATTEPHKIPATIHSRCQRFDFRGVSVPEMIQRMKTIIKEEDIDIEEEAIQVIAESADGGMRDAISLLDQVVSYSEKAVSVDAVHAIKGTVSNEKLLLIAEAIYKNDVVNAMNQMDSLIMLGKEAPRLVENLIQFYRDVLLFKNINTAEQDQLIYHNENFQALAKNVTNQMIFYYIEVLNKTQNDMKWTTNAKLYLELALIKMVDHIEKQDVTFVDELAALKEEIDTLQQQVSNQSKAKPLEFVAPNKDKEEETITQKEDTTHTNTKDTLENLEEESIKTEKKQIEQEPTKESKDSFDIKAEVKKKEESINDEKETKEEEHEENDKNDDLFSVQQENTSQEPYKTYDIRYVEDVLNNGDREAKIDMIKRWYDVERYAQPQDMSYAKMITTGQLVATDGNKIIIKYDNASYCNRMMKPNIKEQITRLLSEFYQKSIDYLALPKIVWEEKSREFIKKWKAKANSNDNKRISLSEITHPGLKEMPTIHKDVDDMTPDSVKEAKRLFGDNITRIRKKGE